MTKQLGDMSYSSFASSSGEGRLGGQHWVPEKETDSTPYIIVDFGSTPQQINGIRFNYEGISVMTAWYKSVSGDWQEIGVCTSHDSPLCSV